MTEQSLSSFKMSCGGCHADIIFKHTGPLDPSSVAISRHFCQECGAVTFGTIQGPNAYALREKTFRLQRDILNVFADVGPPMTVRQVYYRLTTFGAVPKTESGYNQVQRELTKMRRAGSIPYGWISDNTRRALRVTTYNGLGDALEFWNESYRRDLWASQSAYVEIWIEKDALAGQLWPIVREFGVPLYVARGYSSLSFAYESADAMRGIGKEIFIYYLGDYDADGMYAAVSLEEELRGHGVDFHFERISITPAQIDAHNLQYALRPQKRTSTRYNWWKETTGGAMCCELDALHPRTLRTLVHNAITRHIDSYEWERVQRIEELERETLREVMQNMRSAN